MNIVTVEGIITDTPYTSEIDYNGDLNYIIDIKCEVKDKYGQDRHLDFGAGGKTNRTELKDLIITGSTVRLSGHLMASDQDPYIDIHAFDNSIEILEEAKWDEE